MAYTRRQLKRLLVREIGSSAEPLQRPQAFANHFLHDVGVPTTAAGGSNSDLAKQSLV